MAEEKLWSIWQRSKVARKQDKFFGKAITKDGQGSIVASFVWAGAMAIGWYKPLNVQQASQALDDAKAIIGQQKTNTMTQRFPEK